MSVPPSELLGLTRGSYEAYCLDQAVWTFGTFLTSELEKAGQGKKPKGQARAEGARKRVLAKYLDDQPKRFADPMAAYQQRE